MTGGSRSTTGRSGTPRQAAPPRSGVRVWKWSGRLGEPQGVTIDLQTPIEVGALYDVVGCVELSHFMGKSTDNHWPGGMTYNFVEPFAASVRAQATSVEVVSQSAASTACTFTLLAEGNMQPPVGVLARRFPLVVKHPEEGQEGGVLSPNMGPTTPATGTRPDVRVLVEGGRLKLQVRAAPMAEWNDENGGFRNPTNTRKYTIRWACSRAEQAGGGAAGGGQSAG